MQLELDLSLVHGTVMSAASEGGQAARPRGRSSFHVRDTCASNRHFLLAQKSAKITEYRDTAPLRSIANNHFYQVSLILDQPF